MGNCMETHTLRQQDAEEKQQHEEERGTSRGFVKINDNIGKNGPSMKVVLTKEELKWLMLQLNEKGGMRLEQMLVEIERGREKVGGWKPSLERIMEAPEMLEMDTT
ncbi:hypothetical protein E2542_SST07325 [Spatholobus suberectus]|nr:hypothetical protein E2542_SST07325 [Spatholobus suberectus]